MVANEESFLAEQFKGSVRRQCNFRQGNQMTRRDHQIIATWAFGSLTFLFLLGVFVFAPEQLPPFKHKLLSLFSALLSGFFTFFLSGSIGLSGRPRLPLLKELGLRTTGGVAIFVFVLLWWNSDLAPVKVQKKHAIVPVISDEDIHLGDNVYPQRWGYNHNPLNAAIYPQNAKGLIYFRKENGKFFAGNDNQTLIGQFFVSYYQDKIKEFDFSAFKYVSEYDGENSYPEELETYLKRNEVDRFVKIGPAYLYTTRTPPGNFYEPYAAIALVSAVDFTIPLAKSGITFAKENIEDLKLLVECYHGGIRPGQDNNFFAIINNRVYPLPTKSQNMREKEIVSISLPVDALNYTNENVVGLFVLPWEESKPKFFGNENGPVHFRDVGIVNIYFNLTAI